MAQAPARSVAYVCPICSTAVPPVDDKAADGPAPAHRYRPFCSARCQRVDLGNWLGECYTIPASEQPAPSDGDSDGDGGSGPERRGAEPGTN